VPTLPIPSAETDTDSTPPAADSAAQAAAVADVSPPERLRVPWLDVDTALDELGLDKKGALEVPKGAQDVGWFSQGTAPGGSGAAVLTGHVDSEKGPGVFYHLSLLPEGAEIYVDRADGSTAVFEVQRVSAYRKDELPTAQVYSSPGSSLRLVTCGGDWDDKAESYRDNIVAYAELVDMQ